MGIPLRELLQIPVFKRSRVLAGKSGLDREVDYIDVMDLPDIAPWIRPNVFLLSTFYVIRDNPAAQQEVIRTLATRRAAGLCLDPYMFLKGVPPEVERLADELAVPIVELPEEVGFGDIIASAMEAIIHHRKLETDFLTDLLEGKFRTEEFLARRARALNWRVKNPRQVMVVDIDEFESLTLERFEEEDHIQALKRVFADTVEDAVIRRWGNQSPMFEKSDSIILLPEMSSDLSAREMRQACCSLGHEIKASLARRLPELSVTVGIGRVAEPTKLWRSYQQAQQAVDLGRVFVRGDGVYVYDEVEIYSLLLQMEREQLTRFVGDRVGALIEYDQEKGTDLLRTLETYLENEQNLARTSRALFIHRNSLKYRLERIKEILGTSDFSGSAALNLGLAIKMHKVTRTLSERHSPL